MQITHEKMLELTAKMPLKQISIPDSVSMLDQLDMPEGAQNIVFDGFAFQFEKPYLHRYYAGTFRDNKDLWLHNIRTSDSGRHLHGHPFDFWTMMLNGNYTEQYRRGPDGEIVTRITAPCANRTLDAEIEQFLQRLASPIVDARPISSTMLALAGEHRAVDVYDWHRITHAAPDTWTAVIVDHNRLALWPFMDDEGNLEIVKSSPRDWHHKYNVRPESGIIIGDNRKAA
jgi:hypothetical protein